MPVFDLESLPDLRSILHSILDQLALPPKLQVDIFLAILAFDMRYIDGDENIRALLLQAYQIQYNGGEVGC